VRAWLFRPGTLWPFPQAALKKVAADSGAKAVLVPEMNQGQLVLEIERLLARDVPVIPLNRFDGDAFSPEDIATAVREVHEQWT
jgi:2-oxoglutarate ferredoxin oxidoreductase subunit alpha